MKLNAKGMLSKGFLQMKDDEKQFQRNNYGDNYMGMGGELRPYKDSGSMGYDNSYAMGDNMYPKEYMSGTKNYDHGMMRATKRILKDY